MKKILFFVCVFLVTQLSHSQLVSEEFSSKILGGKRKIVTYLPDKYSDKEAYPLFVVFDAASLMEPVIASVRYFEFFQSMPKCIVVGVYNLPEDVALSDDSQLTQTSSQFFDFIGGELVPYIEGKYPIAPLKGVVATSGSASLASLYLAAPNPLFKAVVSLIPDDKTTPNDFLLKSLGASSQKVFYYVATSNLYKTASYKNTKALDDAIRQGGVSEKVGYYFEDFAGASANSVVLSGVARSLDLLFDSYGLITREEFEQNILPLNSNFFAYLKDKYTKIETDLGIKKTPIFNDIMAIYEAIKLKDDWESLHQLSEYIKVNGYGKTAMPSFFLGEYYEKTGDTKKAIKAYQKAYTEKSIEFINGDFINTRISNLKK